MVKVMADKPVLLEKKVANTALDRIKKLDEERAKLLEEATTEARKRAEEAIADLNSLGHSYSLVEGSQTAKKSKTGITRQRDPNKPCDICGFATDPGHDGRVHRAQGDKKKPFTAAELAEKGYKKR
jgi:vacuolar-type H+-ATPase subunit H